MLHVSRIEDNSEEHQPRHIGVVETTANQDRTGVPIEKDKKKNQQEQEDKECDARATPCAEAAVQEMKVDQTGDEHETPDARQEQDKAHAQARARQARAITGERQVVPKNKRRRRVEFRLHRW